MLLILLLICLSIGGVSASAGDQSTNTTVLSESVSDSSIDVISSSNDESVLTADGDGSFTELQGLIDSTPAGNTINLTKSYTYGSGDSAYKNGVVINKALTIVGNDRFYISGNNQSRIMLIQSANDVTFKDVVFKEGYRQVYYVGDESDGAGVTIYNSNNIVFDSCILNAMHQRSTYVDDVSRTCTGPGLFIYHKSGENVLINDCKFDTIDSTGYMPCIAMYGVNNVSIIKDTFTGFFRVLDFEDSNFLNLSDCSNPSGRGTNTDIMHINRVSNITMIHNTIGSHSVGITSGDPKYIVIDGVDYFNYHLNTITVSGSQSNNLLQVSNLRYFANITQNSFSGAPTYNSAPLILRSNHTANASVHNNDFYIRTSGAQVYFDGFDYVDFYENNMRLNGNMYVLKFLNSNIVTAHDNPFTITSVGAILISNVTDATIIRNNFTGIRSSSSTGGNSDNSLINITAGSNAIIEDCRFINCYCGDADTLSRYASFMVVDKSNLTYNNNLVSNYYYSNELQQAYGAFYIKSGNCTITNSNFTKCEVKGIRSYGFIYNGGGNLFVNNSNFDECYCSQNGGVIYNGNNAKISNCNFTNNYANTGGVFYNTGNNFILDHNNINNCYSISTAGVLYNSGSNINVTCNNISDCYSNTDVGVFYISGVNGNISFNNFTNCYSVADYGAILAENNLFENNLFIDVKSNDKGVVALKDNVVFNLADFINCSSSSNVNTLGGVFYIYGDNNNVNNIKSINSSAYYGGAIANVGVGNILNNISIVNSSSASFGGVLYSRGADLTVNNLTIYNSSSLMDGGALYIIADNNQFNNVNITSVNSKQDAGAIYWSGDYGKINGLNITNSTAARYGGALYWQGNNANISNIQVINSNAPSSGGGVFVSGNNVSIEYGKFNNVSSTAGGVLYWMGDYGGVFNSTFDNVYSTSAGGTLYIMGSHVKLMDLNCTNSTSNSGGAFYAIGSNDVYMFNITFKNVTSSKGGAIYWSGADCKLDTLRFYNVSASGDGGAIYWLADNSAFKNIDFINVSSGANGGAVYVSGASCNFTDIYCYNCTSIFEGGSIYCAGIGNILGNSVFDKGNASSGGAISWNADKGTLSNSNFTNLETSGSGGAISWFGESGELNNLNITKCTSGTSGGAIIVNGGNTILSDLNVSYCHSGSAGGAIDLKGSYSQLYDSIFTNNTASGSGGAVNWAGNDGILHTLIFKNNNASSGGAVYIGSNDVSVDNVNFTDNNAIISGGTLYMGGSNYANVSNINIYNSSASSGGSIYWSTQYGILKNATFELSNAMDGGTIYWKGDNGKLEGVSFTDTKASENGGVLFVYGSNVKINDADFINASANNGGGVYWIGGSGVLEDCNFINNTATNNGGGLYVLGSNFTVDDCYFFNNTAANIGGGIYWAGAGVIRDSEFYNNRAHSGSAIFNGGSLTIHNTIILDNKADIKSLVIIPSQTKLEVVNEAILEGWDNFLNGIWTESSNIKVSNVTYWGVDGVMHTPDMLQSPVMGVSRDRLYYDTRLAGMNVTVVIRKTSDGSVKTDEVVKTDIYGIADASCFKSKNNFTLDAVFYENSYYTGIVANSVIYESDALDPSLELELDQYEIKYNTNAEITVKLAYQEGDDPAGANATVSLYINGKYFDDVTLVDGVGVLNTVLPLNVSRNNNMTVKYISDGRLPIPDLTNSVLFSIIKSDLELSVSGKSIIRVGETVNITVTGPSNYSETIQYVVGNYTGIAYLNGTYNITVSYLNNGTVDLLVYAKGDQNYNSGIASFSFTVIKNNVTVAFENNTSGKLNPYNVGDIATIKAKFSENDASGIVIISVNGTNHTTSINNGYASVDVYYLTEGTYDIILYYNGDNKYNAVEPINTTLTINKIPVKIDVTPNQNIQVGDEAVLNINLTATGYSVNGFVTVKVNNKDYNVSITDGKGSLTISGLPDGVYNVNVYYAGNNQFINQTNNTAIITVNKVNTTISVIPVYDNIFVGEDAAYTIEVTADKYIVNGFVTVNINNKNYNVSISNGAGYLTVSNLNEGNHVLNAYYAGNNQFNPSSIENTANVLVNKVNISSISVSPVKQIILVGEDAIFDVNVVSQNYLVNGFVTVTINNKEYNVSIVNGKGSLTVPDLPVGLHQVEVSYAGDNTFNNKSKEIVNSITVNKVNINNVVVNANDSSIFVGEDAIYTIIMTADKYVVNGFVTVTVGGKEYNVTINNGRGSLTVSDLNEGYYTVNIYYPGNEIFDSYENARMAPVTVSKINISNIHVGVISPIWVGEDTIIRINMTTNPSGHMINDFVTVKINNKEYSVPIINNTGSLNVKGLNNGTYPVDVVYNGNNMYNAFINNSAVNILVNKVPINSISIIPTQSNIFVGDDAIYNIELVTGVTGYTVNGFVTVTVDGKQYNVSINNGKGSLTVSGLTNGTYLANVSYAGDDTFVNYNVINKASVTVNKISINSISIVPEKSNIFVGEDAVYNILVNPTLNGFVTVTVDGKQYNVSINNGKGSLTVSGLANGTYLTNVSYAGDAKFNTFNVLNTAQVKVNKVAINAININTSTPSIFVGQDAVYNINISTMNGYAINGFVTVTIGGKQYNVSINDGTGSLTVSGLVQGTYLADVTYAGSDVYNPSSVSGKAKVEVNKVNIKNINITAPNSAIYVDDDAIYNINIIADADDYIVNGFVTVTVGGKQYNVSINNGSGSLTVPDLTAGSYTADVVYAGSTIYNPYSISNKAEVVVSKVNVDISVVAGSNNIFVGEDSVYTIKLTPAVDGYNVNGFVTVTVGGKQYNVSIVNGIGHLTVSGLLKGNYTANASYAGSNVYNPSSVSNAAKVEVNEVTITGISVTPAKSSIYVGEDAVFNVNVMSSKYLVDGFVTLYVDDSPYNVSITGGVGSLTVSGLSAGNHPVYVSYAGDDTFDNYTKTRVSSVNVNKLDIFNINVTPVKSAIFVGEDAKYNINVSTMDGYYVNGVVIITVNNKEYNVSIVNGLGSLTVSGLSEGIYSVDASYAANDMFNSMDVKKTAPVTVNKVPIKYIDVDVNSPIFVGEDAVFAINVVSNNTGYSVNGSVTVTVNNKEYIVVINNGKGSLNVSGLANGNYSVDVVYAGDDIFNAFTNNSAVNVLVNKVPINGISIVPKQSSIFVGDDAVYDIEVSTINGYVVNGFVTVTVGGKQYNVSIINGKGSLTVPGLANGTYLTNVSYAGDDTFANYSVVNKAPVTVNKIPINSISIVPVNSSIFVGQDAVYNIVVSPALNGYVTATVDNKQYNVSISNGLGSFSVSGLANGVYLVNVSYAGDAKFTAFNVTNKAQVKVNKVTTNIIVNTFTPSIFVGENAVYNIKVVANTASYVVDGFVTVTVGGKQYNATIVGGEGSLTVSGLTNGTYRANVVYAGSDVYNAASVSNVAEVKVNKVAIAGIIMSPEVSVITVGEDIVYNINITSSDNGYVVNGFVNVTVGDKKYNVPVIDGKGSLTVSGLNNGTYDVGIVYAGSDTFDSFTKDNIARITVNKVNTNVAITPIYDSIFVGEDAVYNIQVTAKEGYVVNGFVTVTVDGKQYNVSISGGRGYLTIFGLNEGSYLANVTYSGDYQFNGSYVNNDALVVVNKVDILSIVVSPESSSIFVGQDVTCDVNVINSKYLVDGFVTVTVGDVDYNVSITDGKGSFVVTGLLEGNYPIYVSYAGDNTFNNYSKTRVNSINVNKVGTIINVTAITPDIFVGENALYNISVKSNIENYIVNGYVTVSLDGKKYNVSISNGNGRFNASGLAEGEYTVDVIYAGDNVFNSNEVRNTAQVTVSKVDIASIVVSPSVKDIFVDDDAVFDIVITSTVPDKYIVNGFVTVKINSTELNVSIVNGNGKFNVFGSNSTTYVVDVYYAGDNVFNSRENASVVRVNVNKIPTSIVVGDVSINVGETANITAVINDSRVTGNVTFIVDNKKYVAGIINGKSSVIIAGLNNTANKTITAIYSGDYKFVNSSNTAVLTVNRINGSASIKVDNIVAGETEYVEINLPDIENGTISVLFDNKIVDDYIIKGNTVILFNRTIEASGNYAVEVTVVDDVKYNDFTSKTSFNVSKLSDDKYTIDVNVNDTDVFEKIPVTMILPGDANGIISISVDDELVNNSIVVENGVANYTLDNLSSGIHKITVNYGDDVKYGDKTVSTTVNINKIDSSIIIEPPVDAKVNNNIIINVLPVGSTGNITAVINGKEYFAYDKRTIDVSDLGAGNYTVIVHLGGDDNYLPSQNNSVFTVSLNNISLNLNNVTNNALVDSEVILHVDFSANITGQVIFNINENNITVDVNDSDFVEFVFTPKHSGSVNVTASYLGNSVYYANVSNTISFDVVKNPIEFLNLTVMDIMVGDNENISIILNEGDVTGIVTVTIGDAVYEVNITGGLANLSIPNLANGTYVVNAYYAGDDKYLDCEIANITFTVSKYSSFVNVSVENIMVLDDEIINITIPDDAIGYISIGINDKELVYIPINGSASYVVSGLDVGNYSVSVVYYGNEKYYSSNSSAEFTVSIYESDMNVTYNDYINSTDVLHIVASLPGDATGVVTVSVGDKNYTASVENGTVEFDISGLEGGNYTGIVTYSGDYKYDSDSSEFNVTVDPNYVVIEVNDVVKYYSGSERLVGNLSTYGGIVLANESVCIIINNVSYNRVTNDEGKFSLGINLPSGEYEAIIIYNGSDKYASVTKVVNVTVLGTIIANDLIKYYRNGSQFFAYFSDNGGNALVNTSVTFNINGVFYNRTTNASGWAKLNINLPSGQYVITSYNLVTGEKIGNNITVLATIVGYDLVKVYRNGSQYSVFLTDDKGNPLADTEVTFNINGVFYTRKTSSVGWAILNINLVPGEYVITATNSVTGELLSNKITVLSKIIENYDLVKEYGNKTPFVVRIVGDDGNIVGEGELVIFNINGVMYNRYTNASGYASLNVNLPEGKYIITADYGGCLASNKITII